MLVYWPGPVLGPPWRCVWECGSLAGLGRSGSPGARRCGRKSSCRRAAPAGLFFSACLGADRNCQYRIDLYKAGLVCGAVKRGVDTSGNSPSFSRLPRGAGCVIGTREDAR